ncbi:MAG: RagB/SusD family nutrient uptake outer membrane protein [Bacteroidota bacterium]
MKSKFCISLVFLLISAVVLHSCKKMIEIPSPENQLTTDKVFADSTTATSAMVNVYVQFNTSINANYNKLLSCYSDELSYGGVTQDNLQYKNSAVAPLNTADQNFWQRSYFAIYSCNDLIEQLQKATRLSSSTITQFTNEAKFLRAFSYFYLVNTYGSVPLTTQTSVNLNSSALQSDSATVYKQIIQDLKDAQNGLPINYIGTGRVRSNKYSATALLSRVYLWQKDWVNAEESATAVIGSGLYTPLPKTSDAFLANSRETIFSFWTQYGYIADVPNLIPSSGAPQYFYTPSQLTAFESGDLRLSNWISKRVVGANTFYSPFKYHNRSSNTTSPEYLIALRTGEQYLIRAEARAQQNNNGGAIADLNVVRKRAGLVDYAGPTDKASVLTAVLHERQVELFTEWGNRFLDLKRNGTLNKVLTGIKTTWKPTAVLLPIPQYELNTNPNLKQNPGY